jgi:hypothetical protein
VIHCASVLSGSAATWRSKDSWHDVVKVHHSSVIATCSCNTGHQPLGVSHCCHCLALRSVREASVQMQSHTLPTDLWFGMINRVLFPEIIVLRLWCRIIWYVVIRVSEEPVVSNFKLEELHFGGIWCLHLQCRKILPTFRRILLPLSSGYYCYQRSVRTCCFCLQGLSLNLWCLIGAQMCSDYVCRVSFCDCQFILP